MFSSVFILAVQAAYKPNEPLVFRNSQIPLRRDTRNSIIGGLPGVPVRQPQTSNGSPIDLVAARDGLRPISKAPEQSAMSPASSRTRSPSLSGSSDKYSTDTSDESYQQFPDQRFDIDNEYDDSVWLTGTVCAYPNEKNLLEKLMALVNITEEDAVRSEAPDTITFALDALDLEDLDTPAKEGSGVHFDIASPTNTPRDAGEEEYNAEKAWAVYLADADWKPDCQSETLSTSDKHVPKHAYVFE